MSIAIDEKLTQAIDRWTAENRQRLLDDLIRMVRIPSVSRKNSSDPPYGEGCRRALEEMLAIGREHGFQTENYDYHCGALWLENQPERKTVGLWGHLDVVPEGDGWKYAAPYEPVLKEGWLIGRGSQDNKGPSLANLYLMRCMQELGLRLGFNLRLYVGCDEENGMEDVQHFVQNYPCPDLSIITDSGFPVCYGEKGMLRIDLASVHALSAAIQDATGGRASNIVPDQATITIQGVEKAFQGVSKHTAFPEGGTNAIALLCKAMADEPSISEQDRALFSALDDSHQDFYGTGLGIHCQDELSGRLTCVGSMLSVQERHLVQHYNVRYPISMDGAKVVEQLERWAGDNGFRLQVARDSKPNYFPKEHPAVSILTQCYNTLEGQDKEPFVMGGGTYARKLPNAFAFGMGLSTQHAPQIFEPGHGDCHGPDEAQYIDNLLRAMKIMIIGLVQLDKEKALN